MNDLNSKRARDLGFYVLLIAIMIAVIFTMTGNSDAKQLKNYSDLVDLFEAEKVQSFTTEGNTIILQVRTDSGEPPTEEMTYDLMSFNVFYKDFSELIKEQYASGVLEKYDYDEGFVVPWWASMLPYILVMGGAMVLWYFMMSRRRRRGRRRQVLQGPHPSRQRREEQEDLQRRGRLRRGEGGAQRDRRLPQGPQGLHRHGRPHPQGRAAGRPSGHRQDPAGQGRRGRGGRAVPVHLRLRLCGALCRRRRGPCARPV